MSKMLDTVIMSRRFTLAILTLTVVVLFMAGDGWGQDKAPASVDPPLFRDHDLVRIPGGEFLMGRQSSAIAPDGKLPQSDNPLRQVYLDSFYLDKYEVTNYQYYRFCLATSRSFPFFWGMSQFHCGLEFPNHPVVGVSYSDAKAYAQWRELRLPTEAEWEMAARGGLPGRIFPNGDEIGTKLYNYGRMLMGTRPVGSFPANGYGLFDMAGNVSEWVADWYQGDYYQQGPSRNPPGPEWGRFRVFRGGGWFSGASCVTVHHRNALPSNWEDFAVGFRCARDASPEKK